MVKNIPPQKFEPFFILGILCYVIRYVFFTKGYGGSFSSLMTMVGIFFMSISFTYKTKEIELKLHSLIQNRAKEFSGKAFFVVIAYLVYSKILKQEYFGRSE